MEHIAVWTTSAINILFPSAQLQNYRPSIRAEECSAPGLRTHVGNKHNQSILQIVHLSSAAEMYWSIIIWAPLLKSPNWASQMVAFIFWGPLGGGGGHGINHNQKPTTPLFRQRELYIGKFPFFSIYVQKPLLPPHFLQTFINRMTMRKSTSFYNSWPDIRHAITFFPKSYQGQKFPHGPIQVSFFKNMGLTVIDQFFNFTKNFYS